MKWKLFTALAAASLVLCVGASWFWWRSARDVLGLVRVRAGGVCINLFGHPFGLDVTLVSGWPGSAEVHTAWGDEVEAVPGVGVPEGGPGHQAWQLLNCEVERGYVGVLLDVDGTARKVEQAWTEPSQSTEARWSHRLPYWSLSGAPAWLPTAATAILPTIWLLVRGGGGLRHRRHRPAGRCPACGYDLRASPERCPECGAVTGRASGSTHAAEPVGTKAA